jgi:hypothetical protein
VKLGVGALAAGLLALDAVTAAADGAGTRAFQFLNLGASPRIEALGEAGTAVAEGVDALVWNPARLSRVPRAEVAATYFNWLEDVGAGHAGVSWPVGRAAVGLGVRSLEVSAFDNVAEEDPVDQSDLAVGVGAAYPLRHDLHAGVGLKLVRSSLAGEDAAGLVGDVGLDYRWEEGWDVVAAVRNFGQAFGYVDGVDERLPTQAAFGLGSTFGELRVDSEVLWEHGPGWIGVLGAEYRLWRRLALRAGSRVGEEPDGARESWAAGMGLRVRPGLDLDYSFRDGTFSASHRLGVRWAPAWSPDAAEPEMARSPREFYEDVLVEALETGLETLPSGLGDTVVVRGRAGHEADDVVSGVLAEAVRRRGYSVDVQKPLPEIPPDLDEEKKKALAERGIGAPPRQPLLEYEVRASDYTILRARRSRWVGPKTVDRAASVEVELELTMPGGDAPTWSSVALGDDEESVVASRVPRSEGYPKAKGTAVEAQKQHPLVEPAIVGGLVAGLAVIFFSNRDVGE